jgi:hypothetical protein
LAVGFFFFFFPPLFSFFFSILCCSHIGDHPEEEVAKFCSMSERKIETFKNPAIFLRLGRTRMVFFQIPQVRPLARIPSINYH